MNLKLGILQVVNGFQHKIYKIPLFLLIYVIKILSIVVMIVHLLYGIFHNQFQKIIRTFEGHSSPVFSVAIQGIRIISGSQDKIIKIWNLENGKCMITLKGHGSSVVSLQCDDKKLMSGEIYGDIKIWNFVQDFNQGTTK